MIKLKSKPISERMPTYAEAGKAYNHKTGQIDWTWMGDLEIGEHFELRDVKRTSIYTSARHRGIKVIVRQQSNGDFRIIRVA